MHYSIDQNFQYMVLNWVLKRGMQSSPLGPSHLGGDKSCVNNSNINLNKSQNKLNAGQEVKKCFRILFLREKSMYLEMFHGGGNIELNFEKWIRFK